MLLHFIESYNLNLLKVTFFSMTVIVVFVGGLIYLTELGLPASIRQTFRYGKHRLQTNRDPLVSKFEVPKRWFRHFYIFAIFWMLYVLYLQWKNVVWRSEADDATKFFLDFMAGGRASRKVEVNATTALVCSVLLAMQCFRRFYETNYMQIFSDSGKINITHYMVGYIHYFSAGVALLTNTQGFVHGSGPPVFSRMHITIFQYMGVLIFVYAWAKQYTINKILVALRMDPVTHEVHKDQHLIPRGSFFELVSSPHMLFELVMYVMLAFIMRDSVIWRLIASWVVSNQVMNALLTHNWYLDHFQKYPKDRTAIFPLVL